MKQVQDIGKLREWVYRLFHARGISASELDGMTTQQIDTLVDDSIDSAARIAALEQQVAMLSAESTREAARQKARSAGLTEQEIDALAR